MLSILSPHDTRTGHSTVQHNYFLAKFETDPPRALAASLREHMAGGDLGTGCSSGTQRSSAKRREINEMAVMFPEYGDFFLRRECPHRILMKIFSATFMSTWVFKGSSSIKKVLPIIKPELSYKSLDIGDGITASISWYRAAKWDTLAGVEKEKIFDHLRNTAN